MKLDNQTTAMPNLRDFLLRHKLNLSKKSWYEFNDRWHEIYVSKNEPFSKNYDSDNYNDNDSDKDVIIFNLKNQISDLHSKLFILSIINLGLMASGFFHYRLK
jgi:hypothetical protein